MNYSKKEKVSTFTKVVITISLLLVATVITIIIAFGGSAGSSKVTPQNFINNSMQFVEGELQKHPSTDLESYTQTEESVSDKDTILTVFADYDCPHCQTFEEAVEADINNMMNDGTITELRIAPVSYQPTPYSQLGHRAILCIADLEPEKTYAAHTSLMKIGLEGGTDLTTLMSRLGETTGSELQNSTKLCIKNNNFGNFANIQNESAQMPGFWPLTTAGITGTPSVFINEQKYSGNPDAQMLRTAINWVKAGGTLTDLDNNPALADQLDLSDPLNPKIVGDVETLNDKINETTED